MLVKLSHTIKLDDGLLVVYWRLLQMPGPPTPTLTYAFGTRAKDTILFPQGEDVVNWRESSVRSDEREEPHIRYNDLREQYEVSVFTVFGEDMSRIWRERNGHEARLQNGWIVTQ